MTTETNKNEAKTNSLELNQKTVEKAGKALAVAKEEFSKRAVKRPAEELIRYYIKDIDELSKLGASMQQIYERLNKAVNLNITANSFAVYVRRVRKEVGSELYTQRKTKKQNAKDKAETVAAPRAESDNALDVQQEANSVAEGWNCPECKNAKAGTHAGKQYYECEKCGIAYAADNDGNITTNRFSG